MTNDKCKDIIFEADAGISQSGFEDAVGDDKVPNTMICAGGKEGKSLCHVSRNELRIFQEFLKSI